MDLSRFVPFVDGLDHPECVTCGPDGTVYAGGEAGQIYKVGLDGDVDLVGTTGGFILGIALDADANVYACDSGNRAIMRIAPDGSVDRYFDGAAGKSLVNPNYGVFDRQGRFYFSDSGQFHADDGCLWVVNPGGEGELLRDDVTAFPNGVALDAQERFLYVVLSTAPAIVRVPLAGGPVETVVTLERRVPDGIAFDEEGNLYISCYAPDEILRLDPGGTLEVLASDWERVVLAAPTNIAFCGPERDVLVVASLGRWHLTKAMMPVRGQRYNYPTFAP